MSSIVNSYSLSNYSPPEERVTCLEFRPFIYVLMEMGKQIKDQMNNLIVAEKKYHDIFENAVEGIFQSTPDGRFLSANPALARILGYDSPEELIATINHIGNQIYMDTNRRDEFVRLIGKGPVLNFEARQYRKDGSLIWVTLNARPVYDEKDQIKFFEGTLLDITERKRAEDEIRFQRKFLQTAIDALTHPFYTLNVKDYSISHFNKAASAFSAPAKYVTIHRMIA